MSVEVLAYKDVHCSTVHKNHIIESAWKHITRPKHWEMGNVIQNALMSSAEEWREWKTVKEMKWTKIKRTNATHFLYHAESKLKLRWYQRFTGNILRNGQYKGCGVIGDDEQREFYEMHCLHLWQCCKVHIIDAITAYVIIHGST